MYDTAQSIGSGSSAVYTFGSESFDTDTMHDTGSNTGRLTCQTAGRYVISGQVSWPSDATGAYRLAYILLNGSTQLATSRVPPCAGSGTVQTVSDVYELAVGDYVELVVGNGATSALSVDAVFGMARVG